MSIDRLVEIKLMLEGLASQRRDIAEIEDLLVEEYNRVSSARVAKPAEETSSVKETSEKSEIVEEK